MKYFRYYDDAYDGRLVSHTSGELVGRKPLIISFEQKRGKGRRNGKQAAATRMGQVFAEKLGRKL